MARALKADTVIAERHGTSQMDTALIERDPVRAITIFDDRFRVQLISEVGAESVVKDSDGSYWIALYQRCVHLGCTVPFRDDCVSFKCPCHGSHYNVTGEWIDGPAPRSLDRFLLSISGEDVIVHTGTTNTKVPHPDATTRLIPVPGQACSV